MENSEYLKSDMEQLNDIGTETVLYWLKEIGCKTTRYNVSSDEEAVKSIKCLEKYLKPRGYMSKEDLKKKLCEFIDMNIF